MDREYEETTENEVGQSSLSKQVHEPVELTQTEEEVSRLRKRTAITEGGGRLILEKKKPENLVREFFKISGKHGGYSLRQFCDEQGIARSSLRYHMSKVGEEERVNLQQLGREEAENARHEEAKRSRSATWARKARLGLAYGAESRSHSGCWCWEMLRSEGLALSLK